MNSPDSPKIPPQESQEITSRIQTASSIEELITTLESIPEIQGSRDVYSGKDLAQLVRGYVDKKRGIQVITRSNGIQNRVLELTGNKPKET